MKAALAPAWLTGERIALYGSVIPILYATVLVTGILAPDGDLTARDFLAFHAASRLAWAGEAVAAYDDGRLQAMQAVLLAVPEAEVGGYLGWFNPPHFLFPLLPLALFPYAQAWMAWNVGSVVAFALGLRAVMPGPGPLVAALSLPAVLFCLGVGQNGLVIAALLAGTLGLMDRRPVVAGIFLGLLTIKPQFGILFPLVLGLTGRWPCFLAAAGTSMLAAAAAALAFGPEAWHAFLGQLGSGTGRYLLDGDPVLLKIQSVYAGVAHITGHNGVAWLLHGITALAAAAIALRLWLRRPQAQEETRAAALIGAAFLATPYAWTYDMPAFGVAALFLVRAMLRDGALPWDRTLLAIAAVLPFLALDPKPFVGVVVWWIVLFLAWRRDRAWRAGRFSPAVSAPMS